jgi:hypothetical protein
MCNPLDYYEAPVLYPLQKFAQRVATANDFKGDWGDFLPFLMRVGKDYMSDEESERDVEGVHYFAVRAPKFRPSIIKKLFDCLDELAEKVAEDRRDLHLEKIRSKYERYPDGVPSTQLPPPYLPRDCYDAEWLAEDPVRERLLKPAPAMNLGLILEGQNRNQ